MDNFIFNTQIKCTLCSDRISGKNCIPDGCQCVFHRKCLQDWLNQAEVFICPNRKCSSPFKNVHLKKELQGPIVKSIPVVVDVQECPICCENLRKPYAAPECCNHTFCQTCLEEWSKVRHVCPLDRRPFSLINILENISGPVVRTIIPPAISNALEEDDIMAGVNCEICNSETQEDLMLLCDNCDRGYHTFCLPNPLTSIPEGDWYCPNCENNPNNNQSEDNYIDDECLEGEEESTEEESENRFSELNESGQIAAENRALRTYRGSTRLNSVIESLSERINNRTSSRSTLNRPTRSSRQVNQPIPALPNNLDSESEDESITIGKKRHAIIPDDSENEDIGVIDTRNISNMSSDDTSDNEDSEDYVDDSSPIRAPRTRSKIKSDSEESLITKRTTIQDEDDEESEYECATSMSGSDLSLNKIKLKHKINDEKTKIKKKSVKKKKRSCRKRAAKSSACGQPCKKRRKKTKKKKSKRLSALRKAVNNSSLSSINVSNSNVSPVSSRVSSRRSGIVGKSFALPKCRANLKAFSSSDEDEIIPETSANIVKMNSSTSALDQQKEKGFLSRIINAQTKMMSKTSIKPEEKESNFSDNIKKQLNGSDLWSEGEIERVRRLVWNLLKKYQREFRIENSRIMLISEKCIQKIMKKPPYCITDSRATNFINAYIDYDKKLSKNLD